MSEHFQKEIAFLGIDPARAADIDFTAAYVEIEANVDTVSVTFKEAINPASVRSTMWAVWSRIWPRCDACQRRWPACWTPAPSLRCKPPW